jgi:hypothetical protein
LPALRLIDRYHIAVALCGADFALIAAALGDLGRPWAWAALAAVPVALVVNKRAGGFALAVGSCLLRLGYVGLDRTDQIAVTQAAAARVLGGASPYGIGYDVTIPAGAPYPYGPLGLLWWLPGWPVELMAGLVLMVLLVRWGSWLTFGLIAAFPPFVYLTTTGANDHSVALLLVLGLATVRVRVALGAALLALAIALKPYAAAWAIPIIGLGGLPAAFGLASVSLVLWSPILFLWGIPSYAQSLLSAERVQTASAAPSSFAVHVPLLRLAAIPLALASLTVSDWRSMVLIGAAIYSIVLFFGPWTSVAYWLPLFACVGIAVELGNLRPKEAGSGSC